MKTPSEHPPVKSGFCNPSWRLDTEQGRASHARCQKDDCPCTCGFHNVKTTEGKLAGVPMTMIVDPGMPDDVALIIPTGAFSMPTPADVAKRAVKVPL